MEVTMKDIFVISSLMVMMGGFTKDVWDDIPGTIIMVIGALGMFCSGAFFFLKAAGLMP